MRPRKKVLLFCPRSEEGSSWSWLFALWGYEVKPFVEGGAALLALYEEWFELLVFIPGSVFELDPLRSARRALKDMEVLQTGRGLKTLLYDPHEWLPANDSSFELRVKGGAADLRQALRRHTAQKSGPRRLPPSSFPVANAPRRTEARHA